MPVEVEVTTCLSGQQPSCPNNANRALLPIDSLHRKSKPVFFSCRDDGPTQQDLQLRMVPYRLRSQTEALRQRGYEIDNKRPVPQAQGVVAGLSRKIDSVEEVVLHGSLLGVSKKSSIVTVHKGLAIVGVRWTSGLLDD